MLRNGDNDQLDNTVVENLTLDKVDKMVVSELKSELEKRGKDTANMKKAMLKLTLMNLVVTESEERGAEGQNQGVVEDNQDTEDEEQEAENNENLRIGNNGDVRDDVSNVDHSEGKSAYSSNNFRAVRSSYESTKTRPVPFHEVEESLERFDGEGGVDVYGWIKNLDDMREIFHWSEIECLIYAKKLLRGAAKKFVMSQNNIKKWSHLKKILIDEFQICRNSKDVHDQLRRRKKQPNETLREYLYDILSIAASINLEAEAIIQYVVEGIDDPSSDKLMLRGARTIQELKWKLAEYESIKAKFSKKNVNRPVKRKMMSGLKSSLNTKSEEEESQNHRCYNCGAKGHEARKCPDVSKGPKCYRCQQFGHVSTKCMNEKLKSTVNMLVGPESRTILVEIKGKKFYALVDTGSNCSLIQKEVWNIIGRPELKPSRKTFVGFGGSSVKPSGQFEADITIEEENYKLILCVVPDTSMSFKLVLGDDFLKSVEVLLTPEAVRINRVGKVAETNDEIQAIMSMETQEEEINCEVVGVYATEVKRLIAEYSPANEVQTSVETNLVLVDETPVYQKQRRLAPLEKKVLKEQVEKWLEEGVIAPSNSEFASPVVIVRKKGGDYRVCIDYRRLNQRVVKDKYPMPVIEEQLDKLSSAKVFSKLDLKNGFFHVPMSPKSRKYTAFLTDDNHYEFLKTPFGLCNSPASFCRFINETFKDLIRKNIVITYIDDIIVPSSTIEEGIERLALVLDVAAKGGLQIQWHKCHFLTNRVEYLGYEIFNGEIRPSSYKIKAVSAFRQPDSVKDVQSFLGLTGYFRKFIPNYAVISSPLRKLLKKGEKFNFGEEQIMAFKMLKECLVSEPVLRIYDSTAVTEVHTDACKEGIAAVLLQRKEHENKLHPVLYMSKATNEAQKKYHSYELEALAVAVAVKKFRPYLLGIKFKLVTDCSAFHRTINKKVMPYRIAQWALTLQEFEFEIEHRAGNRMKHVDALSRSPIMLISETFIENIKENQDRDELLKAIKEILKDRQFEDYTLQNSVKTIKGKPVLVVPSHMEKDVIRKVHEQGHFSGKKMEEESNKNIIFRILRRKWRLMFEDAFSAY